MSLSFSYWNITVDQLHQSTTGPLHFVEAALRPASTHSGVTVCLWDDLLEFQMQVLSHHPVVDAGCHLLLYQ